jgi:hypothetical protein
MPCDGVSLAFLFFPKLFLMNFLLAPAPQSNLLQFFGQGLWELRPEFEAVVYRKGL